MSGERRRPRRVAVIGGGISGLAAAHRLTTLEPGLECVLLEGSDRVGGILRTDRIDGYLVERSADNFVTNYPWGLDLCRELGLVDELLETDPKFRRALVVRDGRLHPVPAGFQLMTPSQLGPLITSPLLGIGGKLRVLAEYFVPPRRDPSDESLESFAVRRLGREAYERLVQPLVGGIYTADPKQLSMQAALPRFCELEREHGGLIRAARKVGRQEQAAQRESSGARYSLFVAPRDGMQRIVDALVAAIPAATIRLNTTVSRLERAAEGWRVTTNGGDAEALDAVVAAVGAPLAARLLEPVDAALAEHLRGIPYAGASIAVSGYELRQIEHPVDAFGFVVPDVERRAILAASFSSRKFPGRAPDGCVLIRTFLGGATRPEMVGLADDEIRAIVGRELGELLGVRGEPHLFLVQRWDGKMPQYHLGHVDRTARIERRAAQLPGLALVGNAYEGVGVPQCIRSARRGAEHLLGA